LVARADRTCVTSRSERRGTTWAIDQIIRFSPLDEGIRQPTAEVGARVERWSEQQIRRDRSALVEHPHILAAQGFEAELVRQRPDAIAGDATVAVVTVAVVTVAVVTVVVVTSIGIDGLGSVADQAAASAAPVGGACGPAAGLGALSGWPGVVSVAWSWVTAGSVAASPGSGSVGGLDDAVDDGVVDGVVDVGRDGGDDGAGA